MALKDDLSIVFLVFFRPCLVYFFRIVFVVVGVDVKGDLTLVVIEIVDAP